MGDKNKPFSVPEGHADHFPGFVDKDGGYGRWIAADAPGCCQIIGVVAATRASGLNS